MKSNVLYNFLLNENQTEVLLLGPVATNNSIKRQLGSLSNNPHSNAVNLFYFDTQFQFDKHVNAVVKSRFFQLFFQQSFLVRTLKSVGFCTLWLCTLLYK